MPEATVPQRHSQHSFSPELGPGMERSQGSLEDGVELCLPEDMATVSIYYGVLSRALFTPPDWGLMKGSNDSIRISG